LNLSHLALYLLGPPRIELNGERIQISRRKVVALLAYLAVTGTPHSRDALATLLWPERSQSRARAYLRRALSELNRTLSEGFLTIDRETAGFSPICSIHPTDHIVIVGHCDPLAGIKGQEIALPIPHQ
jgi:DNA-binding SARP family transcriptional activator